MENKGLNEPDVIKKLLKLDNDAQNKVSCVAWTTFPYNDNNLEIVKNSLKKIKRNRECYSLYYDENLIFVEKDLY